MNVMRRSALGAAVGLAMTVPALGADSPPLTGDAAFGDWQTAKPGVWRHISPADLPAPYQTKSASNAPGLAERATDEVPVVPDGFRIDLVKAGLAGPRVIRTAPNGDLFVADSAANQIEVYRVPEGQAKAAREAVFASDLDQPYGIAFYPPGPDPQWVYVANTGSVVRFPYTNGDMAARGAAETVVAKLPTGGHWTRDLAFSPDGKTLFVSVGSAANIPHDGKSPPSEGIAAFAGGHALGAMWGSEAGRAAVRAYKPDGTGERLYATGIRNCSGLAVQPVTAALWCVTNERDGLGDNLPPDYATSVGEGRFYGWPWFYVGDHEDPRLAGARPDLAGKVTLPDVLIQAHSAPLGIAFYDGDAFGPDYRGDAFVTLHGSWNRGSRTGYKVVRLKFENGKPTGAYEDFVTGFVLSDARIWGRPVGVTVARDGSLFITDDGAGTIWRVSKAK